MPRYLFFLLLIITAAQAKAQKWEFGIQAGAAGYQGDLNQRNPLQVSGSMAGLLLRYNMNGHLSLKASFSKAQVEGADSTSGYQQQRGRNLSFYTPLTEIALVGEFNFFEYLPGSGYNSFTPFIYAGIANVNYNPQATYKNQTYDLRPLNTEGNKALYKSSAFAIPFGAGVKYNLFGKLSLTADVGYRSAYTDYLDDVSGTYADRRIFTDPVALALSDRSGERTGVYTGATGTQRGDGRKHDTYMFFGVGLSYTFISKNCYY
jgi:hypothetical protein